MITSTLVYVSGRRETVEVANGQFSKKFDLYQGDNDIVVLATDEDTRSNWAGYLHDVIRCNATTVFLCIQLDWKRANCDLDLHVLEPTIIDGVEGRHIYYQNKGWVMGESGLLYPCLR